ncbi:ABC transporter ATP-binding protein [Thermonema rossianum]|jgi:Cu-processing system ATP-binding protein|uniref:ABC transporter ATP-binding protein n=1 Tax=Thermonema rossianum TaxID=55505 RepID=UPI00056FCC64|nr:ABC transporter ATP-binding protein [Thermonema rossianum]
MIELLDISKRFGKTQVLKNISISWQEPGIMVLVGPNGSGKTTLLKMLLGMVLPSSGKILFDGQDIRKSGAAYKSNISYLPQLAHYPENLSGRELIQMVKELRGNINQELLNRMLKGFQLESHLDKKVKHLSGGTLQKLGIVLAFMNEAAVYVLDEPTNGLDPLSLFYLKKLILEKREEGKYILISTHIIPFVEEIADRLLFILEGSAFFDGTLAHLRDTYGEASLEEIVAKVMESQIGMTHVESI